MSACVKCGGAMAIEEQEGCTLASCLVRPLPRVTTPWTDDQVASLNAYQRAGHVHPFTSESGALLVATRDGWVSAASSATRSPSEAFIVQTWAHAFMADWSWKTVVRLAGDQKTPTAEECTQLAKAARETAKAMRLVADQADKLAVVMETRPGLDTTLAAVKEMTDLCESATTELERLFEHMDATREGAR